MRTTIRKKRIRLLLILFQQLDAVLSVATDLSLGHNRYVRVKTTLCPMCQTNDKHLGGYCLECRRKASKAAYAAKHKKGLSDECND